MGERVAPLTRYPTNDIAFTPAVQRARQDRGPRDLFAEVEARAGWRDRVTLNLAAFIAERDSLYRGTANADGHLYIKHRAEGRGSWRCWMNGRWRRPISRATASTFRLGT